MNILDFALQMELDGEKFYRKLAEHTQHADLKSVLDGLADDEQRHYKIIKLAKEQDLKQVTENPSLLTTQNVFSLNKEFISQEIADKLKHEQIDIYKAAVFKEQESIDFYRKFAENAIDDEEKRVAAILQHEEEKHAEVLEDIIILLNHVNDWVESAEFNPKDNAY